MIEIYPNLESLSQAAAELFVKQAQKILKTEDKFIVILSGGLTPRSTYELLAQQPLRDRISWERIHVFWGDERFVPADNPQSNQRMAREALLNHVPIPESQIHPIQYKSSPQESAESYEKDLRKFFANDYIHFNFIFLGLGDNGHTASLFPNTPALTEKKRWASEVFVANQNLYRITLTSPILNTAAVAVFLVSGGNKAAVLRKILKGNYNPNLLPAQLIQPVTGELNWLVDQEAASLLEDSLYH